MNTSTEFSGIFVQFFSYTIGQELFIVIYHLLKIHLLC